MSDDPEKTEPVEAPQRWFKEFPPELQSAIIGSVDDALDRFTDALWTAQRRHNWSDEEIGKALRAYGAYDFVDAWEDYAEENSD